MTIATLLIFILLAVALVAIGSKGGVLLVLSRGIDYARAAVCCVELCLRAARREWRVQWRESLRWARLDR